MDCVVEIVIVLVKRIEIVRENLMNVEYVLMENVLLVVFVENNVIIILNVLVNVRDVIIKHQNV